jgi:hypothetical protein
LLGKTIGQKDVFSLLFVLKLFIIMISAFLMGKMQEITSVKMMIFVFGLVLMKIIIHISTKKNNQQYQYAYS